jgi:hypothetical protein
MASLVAQAAAVLFILAVTSAQALAGICVDVHLRFNVGPPPPALVEAMEVEAAAIWKNYSVDVHWRSPAAAGPAAATLFDVLLDQHHHAGTLSVLGDARLPVQPGDYVAIRIDRQAVEDALRSVTFEQLAHLGHASPDVSDVGRAMGRVLAHELGHALLATHGHQPAGLMRAVFTGEELLARTQESYGLSAMEVARLFAGHQSLAPGDDSTNVSRPSRSRTTRSGAIVSCSRG